MARATKENYPKDFLLRRTHSPPEIYCRRWLGIFILPALKTLLWNTVNQQPIRAVAVDIDGTLTDPNFQVSARNLAALRAAHQSGVKIILATGRRHDYAMPIAQ